MVSGPPLSGKTTYVKANARRGDLIVDVDWIFAALSGQPLHYDSEILLPFVASARDAILGRLMRKSELDRAWIVTSNPVAAQQIVRRLKAKQIDLKISRDEQRERMQRRKEENVWPGFLNL